MNIINYFYIITLSVCLQTLNGLTVNTIEGTTKNQKTNYYKTPYKLIKESPALYYLTMRKQHTLQDTRATTYVIVHQDTPTTIVLPVTNGKPSNTDSDVTIVEDGSSDDESSSQEGTTPFIGVLLNGDASFLEVIEAIRTAIKD